MKDKGMTDRPARASLSYNTCKAVSMAFTISDKMNNLPS